MWAKAIYIYMKKNVFSTPEKKAVAKGVANILGLQGHFFLKTLGEFAGIPYLGSRIQANHSCFCQSSWQSSTHLMSAMPEGS